MKFAELGIYDVALEYRGSLKNTDSLKLFNILFTDTDTIFNSDMIVKSYRPEAASHLWLRQFRANKCDLPRRRKWHALGFGADPNSVCRLFANRCTPTSLYPVTEKIL